MSNPPPDLAPRDFEPEPWGEDPKLVALLGDRGAEGFRALLDGFPEAVGVLWAVRDDDGRIVDYRLYFDEMEFLGQLGLLPDEPS